MSVCFRDLLLEVVRIIMSQDSTINPQWGGRFSESTDNAVAHFTASVTFDRRMYRQDIQGSIAHARMLTAVGVLTETERDEIIHGLTEIGMEIDRGQFNWSVALEDVHMNIEVALQAKIGLAAKKLHTGRSRNDQVATDIRLYLRDEIDVISAAIHRLQQGLIDLAEQENATIMPGFTHLQIAQPVTLGHHLLAWNEMLQRDYERLQHCRERVNVSPLGSAALAGTGYPIDRHMSAKLLGFERLSENSLDSVSDRDFVIEFCACASLVLCHLSRVSEELILWASAQFDFIDLPDRFCTGSSIMPQKKNPDVPELVRGKTGRVYGNLLSLLTLMKAQPLAYNKDNQEDKEPLFDTVETVKACVQIYADMLPALRPKRDHMLMAALRGFSTATDLADYLVCKGMPFRDAHAVVGKCVAYGLAKGLDLAAMDLNQLQRFCPLIQDDVFKVLTLQGSVASRNHFGATAPDQVLAAVQRARFQLQQRHSC
jgi:argininosuccinate lyase